MDFGKVLTRAWQISWQYKVLWLFGFFLGGLGVNGGFNFRTTVGPKSPELPVPFPSDINLAPLLPAIITASCIVLVLVVVFTALRFISEGALIASTQQIETGGTTTGRTAWNSGWRFAWRLFLITFLLDLTVAIPALIAILLFVGPILISLFSEAQRRELAAPLLLALVCACPLICVLVVAGIVLHLVATLAHRAAVLEDVGVVLAVRRGWVALRTQAGRVIILAVAMLLVDSFVSLVHAIPLLLIAAPFALTQLPAILGGNINVPILVTAACLFGIVGLGVNVLHGIFNTFASVSWTLAYREWLLQPVTASIPPARV